RWCSSASKADSAMRALIAVLASFLAGIAVTAHAAELSTANPLNTSTLPRSSGGAALPADEVFMLNPVVEADGDLILVWEMPPSYYLYRKSLQLAQDERNLLPALELPDG